MPLKLFAFYCMSTFFTFQGGHPAALCEDISFPTILPTLDIINLASTNLIDKKWNLIICSVLRTAVKLYNGHTSSTSLYFLASLTSQAFSCLFYLWYGSNQGTSRMPVSLLPKAKQLLAQEYRNTLWLSTCSQANQLTDDSCHTTNTGSYFWVTMERADCHSKGELSSNRFSTVENEKMTGIQEDKFYLLPHFYSLLWGTISVNKLFWR